MQVPVISKAQARRIILEAAGLARKSQFGQGKEAVYRLIEKLGFVQLDTNLVVERAHHHVMATRIPDYQPGWLTELCAEGRVFEYFASDAGYLPMCDFRYTIPVKRAFESQGGELTKVQVNLMQEILDRVERDGPVRVGDFENDRLSASSGWWDWRPAKVALERLYLEGKLMIRRNPAFQKIYDLPLNFVPEEVDQSEPDAKEYAQYVIRRTLGGLGIASLKEFLWRARRVKGNAVKQELEHLVNSGALKVIGVEGLKGLYYMLAEQHRSPVLSNEVFILSPFDLLNVFRHRLKDFFDFGYQLECFVPAAKRQYGYFSLPIIAGDTFIARMDAKADRKNKVLIVNNLHFEPISVDLVQIDKLILTLKDFVRFNRCVHVEFIKSNAEQYIKVIGRALGSGT